jgi:hypothetical protein
VQQQLVDLQQAIAALENMQSTDTVSASVAYSIGKAAMRTHYSMQGQIDELREELAKRPSVETSVRRTKFSELDSDSFIDMDQMSEWLGGISKDTLNKYTLDKRIPGIPPSRKIGGRIRYNVGECRAWTANGSKLQTTFPVLHYRHGALNLEAAIAYEAEDQEATPEFGELLELGEFKYMQLGQQLLESPLPAITPEIAKDFDAATWLFLELTNGKPLPVFEVVEALRHLKESGNDINQPNNLLQRNVAHMLASYGRLKPDETTILMEEFLELGLEINAPDFEGNSALDLAPSGGHIDVWEKRRKFAQALEDSLAHKEEKQAVRISIEKRRGTL